MLRFDEYSICTLSYISPEYPAPTAIHGFKDRASSLPEDHRVRQNAAHSRKWTPASSFYAAIDRSAKTGISRYGLAIYVEPDQQLPYVRYFRSACDGRRGWRRTCHA